MKKFYFLLLALGLFTGVNAQIINFPDANFKAVLLAANTQNGTAFNSADQTMIIDVNGNGEIEVSEALQVYKLNVDLVTLNPLPISNLEGINSFANLQVLLCENNSLTALNLNLSQLGTLFCAGNQLTSLQITGCTSLFEIYCSDNQLSVVDCSGLSQLARLYCSFNPLTAINVSDSPLLTQFSCDYAPTLAVIDVSNNPLLGYLYATHCPQLTTILAKNGSDESYAFDFSYSPNVNYICVDLNQITQVRNLATQYGNTICEVNSYCSFTPGGNYYTINGVSTFDADSNGCDGSDSVFQGLKLSYTSTSLNGNITTGASGNYQFNFPAGSYTITPVLENPTYFVRTPASISATFPSQASPMTQNFCIRPNGIHNDLEITLLPITPARPGFDANYNLIYKNKGTNTQSGTVSLAFDDARLDFVSSVPATTTQTIGNLTWDFANLQPFETREIAVSLNINSPMETPAVNDGEQLDFSAVISPVAGDEIPYDNAFGLKQTVVNSFDPNDKTCLEGTTIAPSEVGKYVHYLIRFENTGTFPAENIVVKDMIDTAKFDINTLVPIKGSHLFVTNITAGNKVEFIFENINLPFDDANNDGYVAFKIKTKPTLVNGDTFSNSASIYFDYNFPIVTNTAVTTIQALSNQDFSFGTYFTVYPNPVKDVLNIETKQTIEVSSISIYNQLGQLVLVVPSAQNVSKVDVSSLASGNYFIKINSDKGNSNTRFIKQ